MKIRKDLLKFALVGSVLMAIPSSASAGIWYDGYRYWVDSVTTFYAECYVGLRSCF